MNNDISLMVEIQRYNDSVVRGKTDFSKSQSVISENQGKIIGLKSIIERDSEIIKKLKHELKLEENLLFEKENDLKKTDDKRQLVTSKKEFEAIESEYADLKQEEEEIEEKVLTLMDDIALKEDELEKKKEASKEEISTLNDEIKTFQERIKRFEQIIIENTETIKVKIPDLSPQIRSKFSKLLQSVDGKGIVQIIEKNCGGCHFSIPEDVYVEADKGEKIVGCPHCGKFLYNKEKYSS